MGTSSRERLKSAFEADAMRLAAKRIQMIDTIRRGLWLAGRVTSVSQLAFWQRY
jgi:hypothetical protein